MGASANRQGERPDMKALTVRQPFAQAINDNLKNIEFRSWRTEHRGELLICAAKADAEAWADITGLGVTPLPVGCHVCVVDLIDVRPMTEADAEQYGVDYDPSVFAWVFDDKTGYMCQPRPIIGALKLFDVQPDRIQRIPDGMSVFDYDYPGKNRKIPKWVREASNGRQQAA